MDAPRLNRSLWLEDVGVRYPRLEGTVDVDVAVIGAGITGVTAACLLKAEGKGERYRATAIGPGVTPDVTWEGAAPATYEEALDRQLVEAQRALYGSDRLCKPV